MLVYQRVHYLWTKPKICRDIPLHKVPLDQVRVTGGLRRICLPHSHGSTAYFNNRTCNFIGFHGIRIFLLTNFHELSFGAAGRSGRPVVPNVGAQPFASCHKVDDQPAAVVEVANILGF